MKFFFLAFALLLTSQAWSRGDELLNGGDILVCEKDGKTSYGLYDFSEAQAAYKLTLIPSHSENVAEILEDTFQRLEKFNPTRAHLYRSYFEKFQAEAHFMPREKFGNIPDEGWIVLPLGCHLEQGVVQFRELNPQGLRYFINEILWEKLSPFDQAGLLMHEFIYREATGENNDVRSSLRVRYFNEVLHSTLMQSMSLAEYIGKLVAYVGFQKADLWGQVILLNSGLVTDAEGQITEAILDNQIQVIYAGKNKTLSCENSNPKRELVAKFSLGQLRTIEVPCLMHFSFDTDVNSGYSLVNRLNFDEHAHLESLEATTQNGEYVDALQYRGPKFQVSRDLMVLSKSILVTFWPNGPVSSIRLGASGNRGYIIDENGSQQVLSGGLPEKTLFFNEDGSFKAQSSN